MHYWQWLSLGIGIASVLSIHDKRNLALCFVSAMFLLAIPESLPATNTFGASWFLVMAIMEGAFAFYAITLQTPAGPAIATVCAWNTGCHIFGALGYLTNLVDYSLYPVAIRGGEIAQVLSLSLFSQPITRLLLTVTRKKGLRHGFERHARPLG